MQTQCIHSGKRNEIINHFALSHAHTRCVCIFSSCWNVVCVFFLCVQTFYPYSINHNHHTVSSSPFIIAIMVFSLHSTKLCRWSINSDNVSEERNFVECVYAICVWRKKKSGKEWKIPKQQVRWIFSVYFFLISNKAPKKKLLWCHRNIGPFFTLV